LCFFGALNVTVWSDKRFEFWTSVRSSFSFPRLLRSFLPARLSATWTVSVWPEAIVTVVVPSTTFRFFVFFELVATTAITLPFWSFSIAVSINVTEHDPIPAEQLTDSLAVVPLTLACPALAVGIAPDELAVNVAVTVWSLLSVTVHVEVPEHPPPDQPANVDPDAGVAVSVIAVPCAAVWLHVPGQLIDPPDTLPLPEPAVATVSAWFGGVAVNVAVTVWSLLSVTVHVEVPEHPPPDQPANVDPDAGVAVSVIAVPCAAVWLHVPGQLIDPPDTLPLPVPASETDMLAVGENASANAVWPAKLPSSPTAMHAFADEHDTARSSLKPAPAGLGVLWSDQLVPSQASAKALRVSPVPTAVHAIADKHDTPYSPLVAVGLGVLCTDQVLPSQASVNVRGVPARST
jgi:hypothetical protein